jgi:hypothetical protein
MVGGGCGSLFFFSIPDLYLIQSAILHIYTYIFNLFFIWELWEAILEIKNKKKINYKLEKKYKRVLKKKNGFPSLLPPQTKERRVVKRGFM